MQLSLEATRILNRPLNRSQTFLKCEDFLPEVPTPLAITHQIILWPTQSICAPFVGTKRLVNIMEFIHVRDVKDFSSVRCARSCLMLVVKARIVSLTKDNEIDVNTAGRFYFPSV